MFYLGKLIHHFGIKKLLIIGMIFQALKYFILATTTHPSLIVLAFLFEGVAYPFCTSAILIFIDSMCTKESRAGIHQTFSFIVYGVITFIGARIAGKVATILEHPYTKIINYKTFWIFPAIFSIICVIWLTFAVKGNPLKKEEK
jgi:MFS family permease